MRSLFYPVEASVFGPAWVPAGFRAEPERDRLIISPPGQGGRPLVFWQAFLPPGEAFFRGVVSNFLASFNLMLRKKNLQIESFFGHLATLSTCVFKSIHGELTVFNNL